MKTRNMNLAQGFLLVLLVSVAGSEFVGKFFFHGEQDDQSHQAHLSVLNKPDSVNIAPSPSPLRSDEISSVLSLSLGVSVAKDITWNGLLAGSLFKRPKALLLLSVSDIPKGEHLKLQSTSRIPVQLTDEFSSVGDIYAMTSTVSLAGHVNAVMDGQSTTSSISADEKIAEMGYSNGKTSGASFWSEMADSWKVVSGDGESHDGLSKHGVLKRISEILPKGFSLDIDDKTVVVNTKELQFNFNLKNRADFNLFSELVFMQWQYDQLAMNKKAVKDGASDVYLFAVSALKGIEKQYGANSNQMKGALTLLEAFIPKLVSQFNNLYGGEIFIVGLTTESELSHMESHKEKLRTVLNTLEDQISQKFNFEIPELHINKALEHNARKSLCESVQGTIAKFAPSLKFKCHNPMSVHKVYRRSLFTSEDKEDLSSMNLASDYDVNFPAIFNIWFWLLVALALATYAISIVMWNMDPGRDSIIYRLTQPKIKAS